ncbi:hypothetical protein [Algoriphagus hitonicola]|uniref:Uncharacterized protein n=1 Tax=Algoriphagus hitonicola TaxID=435880 RepID=A0A1I2NAV5_9BACT|nr:hypothetical protein [Algoriphagus hitonicola]SFG00713.1 hypothetical protein SAMN04487988_1017 [Algoriphagus hitonicola]
MSKLKLLAIFVLFITSSCLRTTDEKCTSILTSETQFQDSIPSGLKMDDGIYAVSIKLKGKLENEIQFNEFSIPAGSVDTLITNRDQYSPTFHYTILNEEGGNVDLDICVGFSYSPL